MSLLTLKVVREREHAPQRAIYGGVIRKSSTQSAIDLYEAVSTEELLVVLSPNGADLRKVSFRDIASIDDAAFVDRRRFTRQRRDVAGINHDSRAPRAWSPGAPRF